MIFQDPLSHLNPVYTVGFQIAETMTARGMNKGQTRAKTSSFWNGLASQTPKPGSTPIRTSFQAASARAS